VGASIRARGAKIQFRKKNKNVFLWARNLFESRDLYHLYQQQQQQNSSNTELAVTEQQLQRQRHCCTSLTAP
jgi:hypothetical protein